MSTTILSVDTMPCGLRHVVKRPTAGEPWTEFYTAPESGDQWLLRPGPFAIACEREGVDPGPGAHWLLISPSGSAYRLTLAEGLRGLRSRLGRGMTKAEWDRVKEDAQAD